MGSVPDPIDPHWPSAASLLHDGPVEGRRLAALLGLHTYATSLSARSATSTPDAIRAALERFSTWSYSDNVDLSDHVALIDYGNVERPDDEGGTDRVAAMVASFAPDVDLRVFLGGDNAATWHALRAMSAGDYSNIGLITLDAHLDMRDGESNGSPVRQLLADGLDPKHVVQVGLADFSNSATYARRAHDAGVWAISRDTIRHGTIEESAVRAVQLAGVGGRRIYVDIDVDSADRSAVPGCPAAAPGGFDADEMRRFVRAFASHPQVHALDITEIDVERDSEDQRTVRLGALLVLEALAGLRRRIR